MRVRVGVRVWVRVRVRVRVWVGVWVGVRIRIRIRVGVGVGVWVRVRIRIRIRIGVRVGVGIRIRVGARVQVGGGGGGVNLLPLCGSRGRNSPGGGWGTTPKGRCGAWDWPASPIAPPPYPPPPAAGPPPAAAGARGLRTEHPRPGIAQLGNPCQLSLPSLTVWTPWPAPKPRLCSPHPFPGGHCPAVSFMLSSVERGLEGHQPCQWSLGAGVGGDRLSEGSSWPRPSQHLPICHKTPRMHLHV